MCHLFETLLKEMNRKGISVQLWRLCVMHVYLSACSGCVLKKSIVF